MSGSGPVKRQYLFQDRIDLSQGNVFRRVRQQYFHPRSFFRQKLRVVDLSPFDDAEIGLFVLFVHPQVAAHFPFIAEKRHAVFPCFGDRGVLAEDMLPHELQAAFYGLFFFQEILIDGAQHRLRRYDSFSFQP